MRNKIVVGNWKMNNDKSQTKDLILSIKKSIQQKDNLRVILSPSFIHLESAISETLDTNIEICAQNIHQKEFGAYTGETSALMLKSIGVKTVIIGHSERREYFKENDEILSEKINTALKNGLEIIYCFGEQYKDRKNKNYHQIVLSQIKNVLFKLDPKDFENVILAYEPIWAIGTGETASADEAQEIHGFIRNVIKEKFGNEISEKTPIIYGGSIKPVNADKIFSKKDVDGGLVGGASLKADDFIKIINSL
ncbi:MAG: triose-phosphate isomerase [Flavobacteriaceae bacterium]|nr:triose-phosphate isomerase [Flavobacteriaceae bacterium]